MLILPYQVSLGLRSQFYLAILRPPLLVDLSRRRRVERVGAEASVCFMQVLEVLPRTSHFSPFISASAGGIRPLIVSTELLVGRKIKEVGGG